MDTVTLKSRGPVSFRRRPMLTAPDGTKYYGEVREYRFDLDNSCRAEVPVNVWDELRDEYLDRRIGLKYHDYITAL